MTNHVPRANQPLLSPETCSHIKYILILIPPQSACRRRAFELLRLSVRGQARAINRLLGFT